MEEEEEDPARTCHFTSVSDQNFLSNQPKSNRQQATRSSSAKKASSLGWSYRDTSISCLTHSTLTWLSAPCSVHSCILTFFSGAEDYTVTTTTSFTVRWARAVKKKLIACVESTRLGVDRRAQHSILVFVSATGEIISHTDR